VFPPRLRRSRAERRRRKSRRSPPPALCLSTISWRALRIPKIALRISLLVLSLASVDNFLCRGQRFPQTLHCHSANRLTIQCHSANSTKTCLPAISNLINGGSSIQLRVDELVSSLKCSELVQRWEQNPTPRECSRNKSHSTIDTL